MVVNDPDEYDEWLEKLVRNWPEVDRSPARFIAPRVIFNQYAAGDELALLFHGEPWIDERITPYAVIIGSDSDLPHPDMTDSIHETAVKVLARDMAELSVDLDLEFE